MAEATAWLEHLRGEQSAIDAQIASEITVLRRNGVTWEQIGQALSITKQAAQQRYGKVGA